MVVTRNGHYWDIIPDLWLSQKKSRFFPLPPNFWAVSRHSLQPDLCDEHFCKIWRGTENYCVKEKSFSDRLFRLDWGIPAAGCLNLKCDKMVRAFFPVLIRLAGVDRGLNHFLISPLSFPPPFGVHSYFLLLYLLLSSIWLCVGGPLTLAKHHLKTDGIDWVISSSSLGQYDSICISRHNGSTLVPQCHPGGLEVGPLGPGWHSTRSILIEGLCEDMKMWRPKDDLEPGHTGTRFIKMLFVAHDWILRLWLSTRVRDKMLLI